MSIYICRVCKKQKDGESTCGGLLNRNYCEECSEKLTESERINISQTIVFYSPRRMEEFRREAMGPAKEVFKKFKSDIELIEKIGFEGWYMGYQDCAGQNLFSVLNKLKPEEVSGASYGIIRRGGLNNMTKTLEELQAENQAPQKKLDEALNGLNRLADYKNNYSNIDPQAKAMKKMAKTILNKLNGVENDR